MPTPGITPEQMAAMLPKGMSEIKLDVERLNLGSFDPGAAHYEARLGAVVWDTMLRYPDWTTAKGRAYTIFTKTSWISINAFAPPETAENVFEEVQGIVSTLKIKEDQKMPQSWIRRLEELLGKRH
jgi:hypothetical protein